MVLVAPLKSLVSSGIFAQIPYSSEQGSFEREQGIILQEQGTSKE
jgi:hypothetical protein